MLKRLFLSSSYYITTLIQVVNIVSMILYFIYNLIKYSDAIVLLDTNGEIMMNSYQSFKLCSMLLYCGTVLLISFPFIGRTKGFMYSKSKSFKLLLLFVCIISIITCLIVLILSEIKFFFFVEILLSVFHIIITMVIYDRAQFLKNMRKNQYGSA